MSLVMADQIGFQLENLLGEGLHSQVYRATRDGFSQHTVAVKIPKDQTAIPLLRREFEILQRVQSKHCVRVLGWESFGGRPALILEWIDGLTLTELAKQNLSKDEQDEIVRQIAIALEDLRAVDIAHGDLHPNNVMIDSTGHVKLIDFACGPAEEGRRQGVPAFASPEIWAGAEPSPLSDLFALQVIRDLLPSGFQDLPDRTHGPLAPFKLPKQNLRAKQALARRLTKSSAIETQFIETKPSPPNRAFTWVARAVSIGFAIVIAASASVSAEAPEAETSRTSSLEITSHHWLRIRLNGRDAGYAPLNLSKLAAGSHRLEWNSAASRGQLTLELKPGQRLRLNESRGELEVR